MKTIKSENYKKRNIISQYAGDAGNSQKLENIKEEVFKGTDIYEAIGAEFLNLEPQQIEQIKDFIIGALYGTITQPVAEPV